MYDVKLAIALSAWWRRRNVFKRADYGGFYMCVYYDVGERGVWKFPAEASRNKGPSMAWEAQHVGVREVASYGKKWLSM